MSKKLTLKKIRRHLEKKACVRCAAAKYGALNIPGAVLGVNIFESITLRVSGRFLVLTAPLRDDYPIPGDGRQLMEAVDILNDSLSFHAPGSLLIPLDSSVLMVRWMRIEHRHQIPEAILQTAALLSRYAAALCEEINLLPDDEPYPRRPRSRPHFTYTSSFFDHQSGDEPIEEDDETAFTPPFAGSGASYSDADDPSPAEPDFTFSSRLWRDGQR